jgi:hypothetical protein
MTVKVLVSTIGQHIIADVKQVENKETKEVIAYWLKDARTISYSVDDQNQVNVAFGQFCVVSDDTEFSFRADSVTSILQPRPEVLERYQAIVSPQPEVEEPLIEVTELTQDESEPATAEVG